MELKLEGRPRGGDFSFLLARLFPRAHRFTQLAPHFFVKRLFRWLCEKEEYKDLPTFQRGDYRTQLPLINKRLRIFRTVAVAQKAPKDMNIS